MNALATTHDNALETVNLPVDIAWPDLQAAIAGNLQKLSAEGQVKYYNALCKFTGLNPLGFPFEWITFQGKLKLYPKKECADQLRGVHKISAKIIERTFFEDICIVRVVSKTPDGREFESTGAVPYTKNMSALDKCKAIKVAETQAYRRGAFGLVGLGNIPDEDNETPAARVEIAGEESVSSRAEKLNLALEAEDVIELKPEACDRPDDSGVRSIKPQPPLSNETAGARANLQEPPSRTVESTPPIAAPAPAREPEQPAAASVVADGPPDDFAGTPQPSDAEKLALELQLVFSEYPQPAECVNYIVAKKQLVKGSDLTSIDAGYAKKILNNPKGFLRSVEAWVKSGRK